MTVRQILKTRNCFRRLLSASPALQYGLARIRNSVSDEARVACGFQTVVNILNETDVTVQNGVGIPDSTAYEEVDVPRAYSLVLTFTIGGGSVFVEAIYDNAVLPEAQMRRVLRQMEHRLKALVDSPLDTTVDRLQHLNYGDILEIAGWNSKAPVPVDQCVHDAFARRASQTPDDVAVDAWDGTATYYELDCMANHVSKELTREHNISAEDPVLVALERSLSTVVAFLGVLKAGGVCVPVDVSFPHTRKEAIASIAGATVIITSSTHAAIAGCSTHVLTLNREPGPAGGTAEGDPSRAACVMFTSGSTGKPKGVVLEHRSLASSFIAFGKAVGWARGTRVLQLAAPAWDACVLETLGPLLAGGCVCIPSAEERESGLADYINSAKVEFAIQTPTALRNLMPESVCPGLTGLMSAGEPISHDAYKTWGSRLRLFNGWGLCETSVCSTMARLDAESAYPGTVGTPVSSTTWIVDTRYPGKLLPIGAVGEVLVEGPGVARGYLNEPAKTAASFIEPPPFIPKRNGTAARKLYRTGDLAKYNPDGSITLVGRQDNRVKIRGQRFELGEVEAVLSSHHAVQSAAAVVRQSAMNRKDLVAVLTLSADSGYSSPVEHIREGLCEAFLDEESHKQLLGIYGFSKDKLPSYMVPVAWVVVTSLPQTTSTKVDRAKIRSWLEGRDLSAARDIVRENPNGESPQLCLSPPESPEEKALQRAWSSVLAVGVDNIGRESSFIRLGGDSITAMQVATRVRKHGFCVSVAALLGMSTLADVASETESLGRDAAIPAVTASEGAAEREPSPTRSPPGDHRGQGSDNRFDQLAEKWTWLRRENIESVAATTDMQAWMLAVGEIEGAGFVECLTVRVTSSNGQALDVARLERACREVLRHHGILRTVFVQHGRQMLQVVLRQSPVSQVLARNQHGGGESDEALISSDESGMLRTIPRFKLSGDGQSCGSLELTLHHAYYDAMSIGQLVRDLGVAYAGQALEAQPTHFHEWVSHATADEISSARAFWRTLLSGSASRPLGASRGPSPDVSGNPVDSTLSIVVPFPDLQGRQITAATVLNAAWSLVLAAALGEPDVVFGYVSANRYSRLPAAEGVAGPCINVLPVRARLGGDVTMGGLASAMQREMNESIPHQHLGFRSIVKECTQWDRSRFNTIVVFQNHRSVDDVVNLGDLECRFAGDGRAGDGTDIWMNALPRDDGRLCLDMYYSSANIERERARWMARCLEAILTALPGSWAEEVHQVTKDALDAAGSYQGCGGEVSNGDHEEPGGVPGERGRIDLVDAMLLAKRHQYLRRRVTIQDVFDDPARYQV